eukprot:scaffold24078_cov72-Phaeocystis_antarctica.AAC.1
MVGGEAAQPSAPPAAVRTIDMSLPKELELQGLEVQRLGMRVRQLASAQQYAEALQVAEQRLALSEQTYGPEHPMSATCLNDVGTFVQATPNPDLSPNPHPKPKLNPKPKPNPKPNPNRRPTGSSSGRSSSSRARAASTRSAWATRTRTTSPRSTTSRCSTRPRATPPRSRRCACSSRCCRVGTRRCPGRESPSSNCAPSHTRDL